MRIRPLFLLLLLTLAAAAQANSAKPGTGAVTGHVYCADTNTPARMATVQLEPVKVAEERGTNHPYPNSGSVAGGVVQTGFDGSFTLANIPPGSYYVVVSAAGYLSPRANDADFDNAEPQPPAGQPPVVIPKVDVQADQTASVDVRIERGASVSGTIRYDDGSPASGVSLSLLHKNSKGKWVFSAFSGIVFGGNIDSTNDLGHYRISGLRDREYLVAAMINRLDMVAGTPHAMNLHGISRSAITIYSGDTPRIRDAVSFKVGAGEERTGEDITIPLSKFHTISGVVTAASDGHPLNEAFVQIADPENKESIAGAEVGSDGAFRIDCIPEGSYLLRVVRAIDKQSRDVSVGGEHHITFSDTKIIHKYGDLEQPIKVEGDIPNLVLAVPEPKKQPAQSASQQGASAVH
jgi:hypothetical protein